MSILELYAVIEKNGYRLLFVKVIVVTGARNSSIFFRMWGRALF